MKAIQDLDDLELDALREVVNIGASHAATALSQLTDQPIAVSMPVVNTAATKAIADLLGMPPQSVVAASMQVLGDFPGRIWLVLPESDGRILCDLLLGRDPASNTEFDELAESTFKEAANILVGAYLNALSEMMGVVLLPSVPSLARGASDKMLTDAQLHLGNEDEFVLCGEAAFDFEKSAHKLLGYLLLFPDVSAVNGMLDALLKHLGRDFS